MENEANNAAFNADEQEILSKIVPDAEFVEQVDTDQPNSVAAPAEGSTTAATPEQVASTTETTEQAAPQGDPRAALRASRRAEKRLRDELDKTKQELEDLRQGKAVVDTAISDAELAELDQDFPLQAKIVRQQRELESRLAKAVPEAQTQPEFEPMAYDPAVQDVIDGIPDLMTWQYDPASQDKFQRAIQYDQALSVDPDWKDASVAERFAEAARRTKAATPSAPSTRRIDPATAIANAPANGPKGISDFRGGAPATTSTVDFTRMSDEQIMSSLPVS